jgi:NAD dependent epimerase/dehydratase family enzyme
MKIVIPGGTGQVGTLLARAFHRDGHDVVVFGRSPRSSPWRVARWDPEHPANLSDALDGADAVINLAGRSVNCRYTAQNRKEILDSRVESVRAVGRAIAVARRPPRCVPQATGASLCPGSMKSTSSTPSGF